MVNLTPAQLPVGSPTDTSVVHSSENNEVDNSKGHNERDISRLQGAAPLFSNAKTYNTDDLVTFDNIVYRSIAGSVAQAFDRAEWDLVNEPARLGAPSTGPTDTSTVIASVNNVVGDTEAHTERDISRLQSSIHEYDNSKTYLEDDLVYRIVSNFKIQYRCIAISTTGTFVTADWELSDGVASKNIVYIYNQNDFNINGNSDIVLEDLTEYIISNKVTVQHNIIIPIGVRCQIRALAEENKLIKGGSISTQELFRLGTEPNKDNQGAISVQTEEVSPVGIKFEAANVDDLTNGDFVNITVFDDDVLIYNFENIDIRDVNSIASTFIVDETFISTTGNITGFWDKGPKQVKIENLDIQGNDAGVSDRCFFGALAYNPGSFFEMRNVRITKFGNMGTIFLGRRISAFNSLFETPLEGITLINIFDTTYLGCTFRPTDDMGDAWFRIEGLTGTKFLNFNACDFETNNGEHAFNFIGTFPNEIGNDALIQIINCKDIGENANALFDTTSNGLDETDPRFYVLSNGLQKNSLTYAKAGIEIGQAGIALSPTKIGLDSEYDSLASERFTVDSDGLFTYTGVTDVVIAVQYNVTIENTDAGNNIRIFETEVFLTKGADIVINESHSEVELAVNVIGNLSGGFTRILSTGDEFRLFYLADVATTATVGPVSIVVHAINA